MVGDAGSLIIVSACPVEPHQGGVIIRSVFDHQLQSVTVDQVRGWRVALSVDLIHGGMGEEKRYVSDML